MVAKKLILIALCVIPVLVCNAQRTIMYMPGLKSCIPVDRDEYQAHVKQIDIYEDFVSVEIAITPKRNLKSLDYYYSPDVKLIYTNVSDSCLFDCNNKLPFSGSLPLLKVLPGGGVITHTYDDGLEWGNVEMDKVYTFTFVFKGTVPDDVTKFDLVDDEDKGCSFRNLMVPEHEDIQVTDNKRDDKYKHKTYYTAYTTATLNLRKGSGINYGIITKIPRYEMVFYDSDDKENNFTKVLYIKTGEEGYVGTVYLDGITPVKINEDGLLEVTGETQSKYSELTLYNDAGVTVNVKFNQVTHKLAPHTKKYLSNVNAGKYHIVASSPGIIPYVGIEDIKGGYIYEIRFYIEYK